MLLYHLFQKHEHNLTDALHDQTYSRIAMPNVFHIFPFLTRHRPLCDVTQEASEKTP